MIGPISDVDLSTRTAFLDSHRPVINNRAVANCVSRQIFVFVGSDSFAYAKWPMDNYFSELARDQGCLRFSDHIVRGN